MFGYTIIKDWKLIDIQNRIEILTKQLERQKKRYADLYKEYSSCSLELSEIRARVRELEQERDELRSIRGE